MIKLRPRPPEPRGLKSRKVLNKKRALAEKVTLGEQPKSADFCPYWSAKDIKCALWRWQWKKCCYCERKRDMTRESDVEHFRPKAEVTEEDDHPGYWWLAYEWSNYLFSCKHCNGQHKRNHFPLLRGSSRAWGPEDSLDEEKPVLINPELEDPEEFLEYDWWTCEDIYVKAKGKDCEGRGHGSIEIAGLNRDELLTGRAELVGNLRALETQMKAAQYLGRPRLINPAARRIRSETSRQRPFAGFRRNFFRVAGLGQYVAND